MRPTLTQPSAPPPAATAHLRAAWERAEALCVKCGFCLPACPTYRETGVEASSPRGRLDLMYAAADGRLSLQDVEPQLSFCLGCQACETACPSGIRFHEMLEAGRRDAAARRTGGGAGAWLGRFALARLLTSPPRLRLLVWALAAYQRLGLQALVRATGLPRALAPRLARLEAALPPLGWPRRWRQALTREPVAAGGGADRPAAVELLAGCVMDAAFGEVHAATVRVLARNGIRTVVPAGQTCCGALHAHAGESALAQALARRNIAANEAAGEPLLIVNSAGCGAALKAYGALLGDDPAWAERAHRYAARVRDVCEFLADIPLAPPTHRLGLKVAYDDPCHLLHAQKIRDQPRRVLAQVPGLELVTLREADMCCGSAGSYSLTQPEMSARLLARKLDHIAASGAQVVATGNPGCLLQLRLGARQRGWALRVAHPVELLAEAYGAE